MASPAPHVLVVPFPSQGHINPMLRFAKCISSMDVMTTVVTLDYFVKAIRRHARRHHHGDNDGNKNEFEGRLRLLGVRDGLPNDSKRIPVSPEIIFAVETLKVEVTKLLQNPKILGGPPLTCIVGDFFVIWVPEVARAAGLPEIIFCPQGATAFAVYKHVGEIIGRGYNPFTGNAIAYGPKPRMGLVDCIPGLPPVHPSDLPFETTCGETGRRQIEKLFRSRFAEMNDASAVLINSFQALEPEVSKHLGPKVHLVGPLVPSSLLEEGETSDTNYGSSLIPEDDCSHWLDMQPHLSVLYVSFGSHMKHSKEQLQELALGLAASNQRFLWVIRLDCLATSEDMQDLDELMPNGFADEVKDRGKLVRWAPQAEVLAHPAIAGFFGHYGWNSVMESLCMGVPILGWPYMMDQHLNCWMLSEMWNIGQRLNVNEKNEACREEIAKAVRQLMLEGEDTRSRARELQMAARKARADGGSSDRSMKCIVCIIRSQQVRDVIAKGRKTW